MFTVVDEIVTADNISGVWGPEIIHVNNIICRAISIASFAGSYQTRPHKHNREAYSMINYSSRIEMLQRIFPSHYL